MSVVYAYFGARFTMDYNSIVCGSLVKGWPKLHVIYMFRFVLFCFAFFRFVYEFLPKPIKTEHIPKIQ